MDEMANHCNIRIPTATLNEIEIILANSVFSIMSSTMTVFLWKFSTQLLGSPQSYIYFPRVDGRSEWLLRSKKRTSVLSTTSKEVAKIVVKIILERMRKGLIASEQAGFYSGSFCIYCRSFRNSMRTLNHRSTCPSSILRKKSQLDGFWKWCPFHFLWLKGALTSLRFIEFKNRSLKMN